MSQNSFSNHVCKCVEHSVPHNNWYSFFSFSFHHQLVPLWSSFGCAAAEQPRSATLCRESSSTVVSAPSRRGLVLPPPTPLLSPQSPFTHLDWWPNNLLLLPLPHHLCSRTAAASMLYCTCVCVCRGCRRHIPGSYSRASSARAATHRTLQ